MKQRIKLEASDKDLFRLPFGFCIQCGGSSGHVRSHVFEKTENNPVSVAANAVTNVGPIVAYFLNRPHKIKANFCPRCLKRFRTVSQQRPKIILFGLAGVLVCVMVPTLFYASVGSTGTVIAVGSAAAFFIGSRILARYYEYRNSPNILQVSKRKITLKVRGRGKFVCTR